MCCEAIKFCRFAGSIADLENHMGVFRSTQGTLSQLRAGRFLCLWWSSCDPGNIRCALFYCFPYSLRGFRILTGFYLELVKMTLVMGLQDGPLV